MRNRKKEMHPLMGIPMKVNAHSSGKPNGVPLKANSRRSEAEELRRGFRVQGKGTASPFIPCLSL